MPRSVIDTDVEKLVGRLVNWKFESAVQHLKPGDGSPFARVIRLLAKRYGNSGWFEGSEGAFVGTLVDLLSQVARER